MVRGICGVNSVPVIRLGVLGTVWPIAECLLMFSLAKALLFARQSATRGPHTKAVCCLRSPMDESLNLLRK
jgi:hypothetical protein